MKDLGVIILSVILSNQKGEAYVKGMHILLIVWYVNF